MSAILSWILDDKQLHLNGELTRDSLLPLWQQRNETLRALELIDISALTRVDSAGLALLVHLLGHCDANLAAPRYLRGASEQLMTLITLYNLQSIVKDSVLD